MYKKQDFTARTLKISLAFAWISIFNSVFDAIMPLIATDSVAVGGLGLDDFWKGVVMALDNILGLFLLPIFGILSDKSRSKYGKRTPYILIFAIAAVVLWILAGIALGLNSKWMFLILVGSVLALNAMSRPASLALLPDLTPLSLRRKANALTQIVSIIATVVGIALVELRTLVDYQFIFYIDALLMAVLIVVFIFTVRENRWRKEYDDLPEAEKGEDSETEVNDFNVNREHIKRNKIILLAAVFFFYMAFNGLVSSLSVYATDVLGLLKGGFTIPQLLCLVAACAAAVPVSKLSKKLQRRHLLIIGLDIMILAFIIASTQRSLTVLMFVSFIMAGIGYSVALVNLFPYMLELSDPKEIGKSTGIFNTAMTVAMVVTPIASGALQVALGRLILFPYCLATLAIAVVLLFFIKDAKQKPIVADTQSADTESISAEAIPEAGNSD
ncbi:MAG: MFS transporter [Clostridiales bacterium]|jgi:Na+/melibiose symporter-like transporter|nr:MFS transporter [Clostridiales bacterium]